MQMPFMARYDPFSPTPVHPLLNSSPDFGSRNGTFRTRPIGDVVSQLSFRERKKRLKEFDDNKDQLIEELLFNLESAENQLNKLTLDHSREAQYNRDGQMRENSLHDQLQRVKDAMDRNAFIIALIDGDGMLFSKELLAGGEKGGREAATALATTMHEFATDVLSHLDSPKLVVRIYANFATLSANLVRNNLIEQASAFYDFVRGFNSTKLLFDFVDAGTEQDSAGGKISELLRMNLYDCHCHQVLLGCSHNNEYARVLEEVRADDQVADHITLIQGVPFERDLAAVQPHFKTTKFEDIFQSTRLGPVSCMLKAPPAVVAALPALTRVESSKSNGSASAASTPSMNWATVTAQAHVNVPPAVKATTTCASTPGSNTTTDSKIKENKPKISNKTIDKNRLGMRVDRVDDGIPNYEIQRVKKLKLCNVYYLQGRDQCTSNHCSHRHDYPISNFERKILREVARMTPCYYKTECDDPDCIYGHRCPQSKPGETGCYYGQDCRFYGWGHGIDMRVCKTVKV